MNLRTRQNTTEMLWLPLMINNYTDIISNIKLNILTSVSYITISHILSVCIIILRILSNMLHILFSQIPHYSYTHTYLILTTNLKFDNSRSLTELQFKHIERQVDKISTLKVFWRATKYLSSSIMLTVLLQGCWANNPVIVCDIFRCR